MPYIKQQKRPTLDKLIDKMIALITQPGELAYVLFGFFKRGVKLSFLTFCIWIGAIILTVFEIYRRIIAAHEDRKIQENGDVD